METLETCNLCGSNRFQTYAEKRGPKTGTLFRIVRCRECGLIFVNPRLTESENLALYDEAYFNGRGFDSSVNYVKLQQEGDRTREGENGGIIDKIRALKPGSEWRVLDVGCGTGSLLRALVREGYRDVTGLELSEYAASIARDSSGAHVLAGDIVETDLHGERFDVINATEVVEHVRDPLAFFRRVKELLSPDGVFIYSTGNSTSAYARSSGQHWPYLNPEGHLFYYSPQTLVRYFEAVGLRPVRPESIESTLRRRLARAEGRITHSQVVYVGTSSPGLKGIVFRLAGAIPSVLTGRALARFQGRLQLPLAVNRV
jgi:2-polyprenyl-3-methyl-5-hydroxy-6-metoxy-1,4-benzoquinol methylase